MFEGCSSLTSVEVSGFDTSQVTDMNYMFEGCSSLRELNTSGFRIGNDKYKPDIIKNCYNLETIISLVSKCKISIRCKINKKPLYLMKSIMVFYFCAGADSNLAGINRAIGKTGKEEREVMKRTVAIGEGL